MVDKKVFDGELSYHMGVRSLLMRKTIIWKAFHQNFNGRWALAYMWGNINNMPMLSFYLLL